MKYNQQSGNALWFILIAIVLLGGLTVMMSRSSGTSEDSGDYERSQIQVSEVARYAKSIELAVQNLRNNECSENDLNFDTPLLVGHDNITAPANESCDVFSAKGGGMTYKKIPPVLLDTSKSAQAYYGFWVFTGRLRMGGVGGTDPELSMIAPFLTKDFCMKLNTFLKISNVAGDSPMEDTAGQGSFLFPFTGTFVAGSDIDGNGNALGQNLFLRQKSGCTKSSSGDSYNFFHVLIAR
jgi:hypothetical protein